MSRVHIAVERRSRSEGLREIAQKGSVRAASKRTGSPQEEWRGALTSVTNTLAGLVSACERIVSAADDHPTAAVSQLVERLVTAAAADARNATQHIEAQAQADAAEAQTLIDRLQSEIREGQEQLRTAREQLQEAHNARAQAESTAEKLQAVHTQATSGLQSQLRNTEAELQLESSGSLGPQAAARSRTGGARESHCDTRGCAARRSSGSLSDRTRPVSSFSLTALNGASPERCRRGSRVRRAIRCGPIGGTEPGTVGLRLHGSPGRRQLWGHWRLRRDVAPGHRNNVLGRHENGVAPVRGRRPPDRQPPACQRSLHGPIRFGPRRRKLVHESADEALGG